MVNKKLDLGQTHKYDVCAHLNENHKCFMKKAEKYGIFCLFCFCLNNGYHVMKIS